MNYSMYLRNLYVLPGLLAALCAPLVLLIEGGVIDLPEGPVHASQFACCCLTLALGLWSGLTEPRGSPISRLLPWLFAGLSLVWILFVLVARLLPTG